MQTYVALCTSLDRCVDEAKIDATTAERARFVVSLFEDAIAPTNFLASNPAALRKLVDTKGTSVIRGLANFVEDLASGTWLPRQVDTRPFARRQERRDDAGRGRLPQRAAGADPVRADDA